MLFTIGTLLDKIFISYWKRSKIIKPKIYWVISLPNPGKFLINHLDCFYVKQNQNISKGTLSIQKSLNLILLKREVILTHSTHILTDRWHWAFADVTKEEILSTFIFKCYYLCCYWTWYITRWPLILWT